jgi:N4-gp56 family major capsid protein
MTLYTEITPRTNLRSAAGMLERAAVVQVLQHTATMQKMPKNKSQTLKFRRFNNLSPLTSNLVEGVTPSPTPFTVTDITATLYEYGQVVTFTDVIEDTHEDPVVSQLTDLVGENVGRTNEALDWAVVRAGSSVVYANGTQRTDVNTPISLGKVRSAVRTLDTQKARKFNQVITPGLEYATRGIEASWIAVCHTSMSSDIRNLPGFIPTVQYGQRKMICEDELGAVENIRFLVSADLSVIADGGGAKAGSGTTMVSTAGTSADIYPVVIFGRDSWARVELAGYGSVEADIIPAGRKDKSDPLGQRGSVSSKWWHTAVRLNESWMIRIECAATSL